MFELDAPVALGFPEKFGEWRPSQLNAIEQAFKSDKRVLGLVMPTGSGKSLTYVALALLSQGVKRAAILTSTKGLQDQVERDFRALGLVDVRGQRNYVCRAVDPGRELDHFNRAGRSGIHACDDGPCHMGVPCSLRPDRSSPHSRPGCDYYAAVFDAKRAPLVVTNYSYWMSANAYGQGLGQFEMLIGDEAHDAEKELGGFLSFQITDEDAGNVQSKMLDSDDLLDWIRWADALIGPLKESLESAEAPDNPIELRLMRRLQLTAQKLTTLSEIKQDEWVLERTPRSMSFAPVKTSRYAEKFLFHGIPKIVLTSATLTHKTLALLGVQKTEYKLWEAPSDFPIERRPIIHTGLLPMVRVDHRITDGTKLMWRRRIDRIITPRLGTKGIIHTVSYARAKELLAYSEHKRHMLLHDSMGTKEAVARFKAMRAPSILVSPSMSTGWDFPDTECRWQIIGKLPIPDTRGQIMSVRKEQDPEYIPYLTAQQIVQMTGRGMRSAEDWCETFIVDDHIEWFVRKYRSLFPSWFLQAYESVSVIPAPLIV